jgi:putative endonuclease
MNKKQYYIYLITNQNNTAIYTGVTSNLTKRIWEHKNKLLKGFTQRYNINKLVYYEIYDNPENAITREKQIKAGSRKNKVDLIKSINPEWKNPYDSLE